MVGMMPVDADPTKLLPGETGAAALLGTTAQGWSGYRGGCPDQDAEAEQDVIPPPRRPSAHPPPSMAQFSSWRGGAMRAKWRVLLVTSTAPREIAWAAIMVSISPMG